jgi:hypothetical protein
VRPDATIYWQRVPGADAYGLQLGRTLGDASVLDSAELTDNWIRVPLPANTVLFARLRTRHEGVWRYVDTSFVTGDFSVAPSPSPGPDPDPAPVQLASFLSPEQAAIMVGTSLEFTWTEVAGVIGYHLHVGTFPGADDIGMSPDYMMDTRYTIDNLPPNRLLYARLYSQVAVNDFGHFVDLAFTTAPEASATTP